MHKKCPLGEDCEPCTVLRAESTGVDETGQAPAPVVPLVVEMGK